MELHVRKGICQLHGKRADPEKNRSIGQEIQPTGDLGKKPPELPEKEKEKIHLKILQKKENRILAEPGTKTPAVVTAS